MKASRAAAFAPFLLALASCWTPPFDPAISLSELTARKMESVASIGPVEFGGIRPDKSYFVPAFAERPGDGYWVCREGDERLTVRYVGNISGRYSVGPVFSCGPARWGELNAVQGLSAGEASSDWPGLQKGVCIAGSGSIDPTMSIETDAILGVGLDSNYSFYNAARSTILGFSYPMSLLGGEMRVIENAGTIRLRRSLLMAGFSGGSYRLAFSGPPDQDRDAPYARPSIAWNELSYDGPELAPGAFFTRYTDTLPRLLLVGMAKNGSIVGLRWNADYPLVAPVSAGFDARITDALHDGRLLARGEYLTSCYDANGDRLFDMRTGSLRFIYERLDAAWYSYFTRVVVRMDSRDDSKGTAYFDVFRYPTASLAELGG